MRAHIDLLIAISMVSLAGSVGACKQSPPQSHEQTRAEANQPEQTAESASSPHSGSAPESDDESAVDGEVRSSLLELLSGYEHFPSRKELDQIAGAETMVPTLLSIYRDKEVVAFKRQRVIGALRYYSDPRVRKLYESLLDDPETPTIDRRLAVKAYAAAYGDKAVPLVQEKLSHPDYHTRKAAVVALDNVDTPAARKALENRLDAESEKLIRKRIQEALTGDQ